VEEAMAMNDRIPSKVVVSTLVLAILAALAGCVSVRPGQHPYSSHVNVNGLSGEVRYLLYLPESYGRDRNVRWPLVLFLHGMAERGSDLELLKKHPLPQLLETRRDFPFIVVSPQLGSSHHGWDPQLELLNGLLLELQARYAVDPKRIYATGLSMGGGGTWKMAFRYPHRFAAIVPVAGYYEYGSKLLPPNISDLRDLPIWAFHGAKDESVQLYQDEIIVGALRASGSKVKFTVYEDAGHEDTWRRAYADPAVFEWMLAQSLP
jgi:predicted peptidase